jgi:hypothetical protein
MALGVLVPLFGILAARASGATNHVNGTTRSWFERDVASRGHVVTSGARDALATHVRALDRKKLAAVLDEISFVASREAAMRRFTVVAFAVVALLASIATFLVRMFTRRLSMGLHPVEEARR